MTLLQMIAARDEALKALLAAKTDDERAALTKKFEAAALAVATAKAKAADKAGDDPPPAKDDEEEDDDEDDDDEEEEEEDDEDAKAKAEKEKAAKAKDDKADDDEDDTTGGGDDTSDGGDEDEEEDDEEAKANRAKFLANKLGAFSPKKMLALVMELTGQRDPVRAMGALAAMPTKIKSLEETKAKVDKLLARSRNDRIDALVARARTERRISSAQAKDRGPSSYRAMGAKMGTKFLKAHLAQLPKRGRSEEDGPLSANVDPSTGAATGTPTTADQKKIIEQLGVGVEDPKAFGDNVLNLHAKKAAGSTPRT